MARPRSEDKIAAILDAAVRAIEARGLEASTYEIAKTAGVATGTLFTYFPTKNELFAQLYLHLKQAAYAAVLVGFPVGAAEQVQIRHFWDQYVRWGVAHPQQRRVLHQLLLSGKIAGPTQAAANEAFTTCTAALQQRLATGALHECSSEFAMALLTAMAETTIDFVAREPQLADNYRVAGFEAFWRATAPR